MDFFKSKKAKVFSFLVILSIIIGILSYTVQTNSYFSNTLSFIVVPIQKTFNNLSNWTTEQFNSIADRDYLKTTNEELFIENEILKAEVNRLKQLEEENLKLSNLLDTTQRYPQFNTQTANIIASDSNYWYKTFFIDKGKNDGIELNMVILANGGLVGRVTEIGPNYSKVTSILDEFNSVSVRCLRTNDLGILKGSTNLVGDNFAIVEYLDLNSNLVVGDEIVTSHLSDIYPSNIVIGTVSQVYINDDNITKSAIIEPIVDFSYIDKVLIIENTKVNIEYGNEGE